jgi:CheY-like chemotaxis protein
VERRSPLEDGRPRWSDATRFQQSDTVARSISIGVQGDKLVTVPLQFRMTGAFAVNPLGRPVSQVNVIGLAVPAGDQIASESSRGFWMAGTVAVVDDEEDVREVLRVLLETAGHTVRLYASGSSLLSEKDIDQIDCVIIDQNMPGLRGTDVLLEIDRRHLALPSVLVTGAVDQEVTTVAQHLGAMTVMVKPIRSDQLLRFVGAAVG